jgi:hypothetical protein
MLKEKTWSKPGAAAYPISLGIASSKNGKNRTPLFISGRRERSVHRTHMNVIALQQGIACSDSLIYQTSPQIY